MYQITLLYHHSEIVYVKEAWKVLEPLMVLWRDQRVLKTNKYFDNAFIFTTSFHNWVRSDKNGVKVFVENVGCIYRNHVINRAWNHNLYIVFGIYDKILIKGWLTNYSDHINQHFTLAFSCSLKIKMDLICIYYAFVI